MRRVLVMEDEEYIREFIVINLKRSGYDVLEADTGQKAMDYVDTVSDIDIAILDVMLPDTDGFTVCKHIRERNQVMGILMLTAKTQEMDKVTGLMSGADDYVTKPFSPAELTARIDALYRRVAMSDKDTKNEIVCPPFKLNTKSRTLYKDDRIVDLTQVEYSIIKNFIENPETAMSREEILNTVWGKDFFGELKIVDVNVRRIRKKIEEDPAEPKYIRTIWGYGYKWSVPQTHNR